MVRGIPRGRLALYLVLIAALSALLVLRYGPGPERGAPAAGVPEAARIHELPDLSLSPALAGFGGPPVRDLFRVAPPRPAQPPPPPPPAPVRETPAPDPDAARRAEVERVLDAISVIGFLSTGDGVMAVLKYQGSVKNVLEGDTVVPGFVVKSVALDSVTVEYRELGITRRYGSADGN